MLDIAKLEGIASAIESESRMPSPSHNNLARLVGSFLRVIIDHHKTPAVYIGSSDSASTPTVEMSPAPEIKPKRKGKKAN